MSWNPPQLPQMRRVDYLPSLGKHIVVCRTQEMWDKATKIAQPAYSVSSNFVTPSKERYERGTAFHMNNGRYGGYCDPYYYDMDSEYADYEWLEFADVPFPLEVILKKTMKSIKDQFNLLRKPEPMKTFFKAGIVDDEGILTADGGDLFETFLLEKFGAEFKTEVVDVIIAEQKKDAKDSK